MGTILSQQQGNPSRLHPCTFFSRKLSPADCNYDIGNQELLAIKLALEEWRHWLEGAKHPFTVLTDHKNLQYVREAKRLNPRQARWALLFTRFNCKITYHPGPKNIKADALSRLHAPEEVADPTNSIIPESMFFCPIQWNPDSAPSSNVSTAKQMFNHMFRYFGIPKDIVSDRGPQFISRVWKNFLKLLGVTVSLSSGYHPQTNGRRRERSRKLVVSCEPSATATSTLGTSLLAGPSTPRTPFVNKPLDSLPSSVCLVSSHLCSPGMGNHQMYLQ